MGILSDILNDAPGVKPLGTVSHMERCLASDSLIAMDAEQWITIHPNGEGDNRHIQIDDETGEILKGGAVALLGTNIKDFGKNMKNKERGRGMSIKTVDEYRAKEDELYKELVKAGHVRNRKDFDEAYSGIKHTRSSRSGIPSFMAMWHPAAPRSTQNDVFSGKSPLCTS